MANAVYEGEINGGNLFDGLKFCILQRVPLRSKWLEVVEANGGTIVKLEKQADLVIADRIRKDVPPGSTDWRFIEESLKKGVLEDKADHSAGAAEHTVREAGSGRAPRVGRTPFTAEDDRVLTKWVTRAERAGVSTKGNELYKQLEKKNPRHTYQSWRDHWVKTLSLRHRVVEEVEDDIEDNDNDDIEEAAASEPVLGQRSKPSRNAITISASPEPESQSQSLSQSSSRVSANASAKLQPRSTVDIPDKKQAKTPWVTRSSGEAKFTAEEDSILVDKYEDILAIESDEDIEAWTALSVEHPNHTAQEWKNHFKKVVGPSEKKKRLTKENEATGAARGNQASDASSQPEIIQPGDMPDSNSESLENDEVTPNPADDPTTTNEREFRSALDEFAYYKTGGLHVVWSPNICGRKLPLFEIWQVITSNGINELNTWQNVAKTLKFHPTQHPTAHKELRDCYEKYLTEFKEMRATVRAEFAEGEYESMDEDSQEDSEDEDSQEKLLGPVIDSGDIDEMLEAQLLNTATVGHREDYEISGDLQEEVEAEEDEDEYEEEEEEEEETALNRDNRIRDGDLNGMPSPKPISTSRKRALDKHTNGEPFNKRQRVDKGKGKVLEIPSTPEDIINDTPRKTPFTNGPSPLKESSTINESTKGSFIKSNFQRPGSSSTRSKNEHAEPETQDFSFPIDDEVEDLYGDGSNIDPSPTSPSLKRNGQNRSRDPTPREKTHEDDSSTQSQDDGALFAFVEHCIAMGHNEEVVTQALKAASWQGGLAMEAMEDLANGKGIPNDIRGVWTAEDDRALEKENGSSEYKRILAKHGEEFISIRRTFWQNEREELARSM